MGLGITNQEAERLIDAYFEVYPRIKVFIEDSHRMALLNHWIFSPFGQRKMEFGTYPCFRKTAVYNAAMRNAQNVRIQGPASTLGLIAFSRINDMIKPLGGKSICTVYDSIEIEVDIQHAAKVLEIGFECMDDWPQQEFDWLNFPIGADAEIGFDWGTLSELHRHTSQEDIEAILKGMDPVKYQEAIAA